MRLMYLARSTPRILLPLLVSLLFGCILPPSSIDQAAKEKPPLLRIQSLAVSDVDGDQILDRATVTGTGANKSIRVCSSHNHCSSVLSFSSASPGPGSLLASDVDHDGDVDLVWTGLTNSAEVVVWLNDGLGGFERAPLGEVASEFVLGGRGLGERSYTERQTAGATSHRQPLDAGLPAHRHALVIQDNHYGGTSGCAKSLPSAVLDPERGPPALLI